jgi:hypothetical protein
MSFKLDSKCPDGPIGEQWTKHKFESKLVNPANKRKFRVIVVGTGLGGASAAASVSERTPSPRRAESTPPRTTRTTATPFIASSTTP